MDTGYQASSLNHATNYSKDLAKFLKPFLQIQQLEKKIKKYGEIGNLNLQPNFDNTIRISFTRSYIDFEKINGRTNYDTVNTKLNLWASNLTTSENPIVIATQVYTINLQQELDPQLEKVINHFLGNTLYASIGNIAKNANINPDYTQEIQAKYLEALPDLDGESMLLNISA